MGGRCSWAKDAVVWALVLAWLAQDHVVAPAVGAVGRAVAAHLSVAGTVRTRTEQNSYVKRGRPSGQPHTTTQSNKQNTVIADEAHTKYINSNRRRTRAYRSFEASKLH